MIRPMRGAVLAAGLCAATAAIAQTSEERWYGTFTGSEILGRDCTITGGAMDLRTRFGSPSFVQGSAGVPAVATEALVQVYQELVTAAREQDFNAIINYRVSVQMVQDYVLESGGPQQRGDATVYADGAFLIIAQGDLVAARCD